MKYLKPERAVYDYLFEHPVIIQAMIMRFPDHWRLHAERIRDGLPPVIDGNDGYRVITQTVSAEAVKLDQIFAHDGLREFRIILKQFDELFLLQHQNGNILGYFDSVADANSYAKAVYGEDMALFAKLTKKFASIDHRGLGAPGIA